MREAIISLRAISDVPPPDRVLLRALTPVHEQTQAAAPPHGQPEVVGVIMDRPSTCRRAQKGDQLGQSGRRRLSVSGCSSLHVSANREWKPATGYSLMRVSAEEGTIVSFASVCTSASADDLQIALDR